MALFRPACCAAGEEERCEVATFLLGEGADGEGADGAPRLDAEMHPSHTQKDEDSEGSEQGDAEEDGQGVKG